MRHCFLWCIGNIALLTLSAGFIFCSSQTPVNTNLNTTNPIISIQPRSQSVPAGYSVTLSVTASRSPIPTYQWKKGSADISEATRYTYTIAAFQISDTGTYTVVVSNGLGSTTSNPAMLTLIQYPSIIITSPHADTTVVRSDDSITIAGTIADVSDVIDYLSINGTDRSTAMNLGSNTAKTFSARIKLATGDTTTVIVKVRNSDSTITVSDTVNIYHTPLDGGIPSTSILVMDALYTMSGDSITMINTSTRCSGTTLVTTYDTSSSKVIVTASNLYIINGTQTDSLTRIGSGSGIQGSWSQKFSTAYLIYYRIGATTLQAFITKAYLMSMIRSGILSQINNSGIKTDTSNAEVTTLTGLTTGEVVTMSINNAGQLVYSSSVSANGATTMNLFNQTDCTSTNSTPPWFTSFLAGNVAGVPKQKSS